jgi:hypothetical protein
MSPEFVVGFIVGVIAVLSFITWDAIRTETPIEEYEDDTLYTSQDQ